MRIFFALAVGLLFVVAAPAFAQPHIQAVVSGADFSPGIALGGIGTVFGTGLSDKQYQFGSSLSSQTRTNRRVRLPGGEDLAIQRIHLPGAPIDICQPLPNQLSSLRFATKQAGVHRHSLDCGSREWGD